MLTIDELIGVLEGHKSVKGIDGNTKVMLLHSARKDAVKSIYSSGSSVLVENGETVLWLSDMPIADVPLEADFISRGLQ